MYIRIGLGASGRRLHDFHGARRRGDRRGDPERAHGTIG